MVRYESEEVRLLGLIQETPRGADRTLLIDELENAPIHMRTFYARWLFVHDVAPWNCWSDTGYDATASTYPRDVQLLAAACYGKADIDNGGFHQFFSNPTGVFAPEITEWFQRAGLDGAAKALCEAIALFGGVFPRSQAVRNEILRVNFNGPPTRASREEWDPFIPMDDAFYEAATDEAFDRDANHWLRNVCGISRLRDSL